MTTVDAASAALVLVDLMPRIVELEGLGPHAGPDVVARACELARRFAAAGAPVIAIRVERPGVAEQPPGSALHPDVAAVADVVVVKRTIGGFQDTGLDVLLRERGASTLVFAGIATNLGVESTARAASDLGYDLVFVEDAMTALTAGEHEAAVRLDLPRFGEVVRAADVTLA